MVAFPQAPGTAGESMPLIQRMRDMHNEPDPATSGGDGVGAGGDDPVALKAALKAAKDAETAAKTAAAAAVAEAARMKAEQEEAARAAREKDGDILGLYDEVKAKAAAAATALEQANAELATLRAEKAAAAEALKAANAERLGKLPEDLRALVPDGLSPEATRAQLERLEATAARLTARPEGGRGGPRATKETPAEKIPAEYQSAAEDGATKYGYQDPLTYWIKILKPSLARRGLTPQ